MDEKIYSYMDWPRIEAVVYGEEASPKDVMGPRLTADGILVQGFFPDAEAAEVLAGRKAYPMERQDEAGYFAALIPGRKVPAYRFRVKWGERTEEFADPYAFPGQITEDEEKAFCAGVYYKAYEKLGAHPMTVNGVEGTHFAVWAPNAMRVSVVGEFNNWDGRSLLMHKMPMSGIFEIFVPGVKAGASYKYEIKIKGGALLLKADPYANASEQPRSCASVVADLRGFAWNDEKWMKERKKYQDRRQPVSIYETSLTDWESGADLVKFVSGLGYTHVELLPVMEYLDDSTNGYGTSAYYAPTTRFGSPEDFQKLVDELHQAGVGVILDWTPAQFPRFDGGMESFDGTPLYEVQNPALAVHPMWGTMLYNYESPMVRDFLIANACYWMEVYHADGLRMDDVDAMLYLDYGRNPGEWTPNLYGSNENLFAVEFIKHLNSIVKKRNPGVLLIAQEDGLWPELTDTVENDHLGFDYKWSGGWTADFLSYLSEDPIRRRDCHDQLTLSTVYAYCEHYVLTLARRDVGNLENFMNKLPGSDEQKLAQVRAAYAYMMLHPGCKMMAPDPQLPKELGACILDLNQLYSSKPALYTKDDDYDGFEWIQLMKYEENVLTFLRKTDKPEETLLAVCNFAAVPHEDYKVGVPFYGKYKEVFNSDQKKYGGWGTLNTRMKTAKKEEWDEREYSISLKVPALGVTVFTCTPAEEKTAKKTVKKTAGKKTAVKKAASKPAAETTEKSVIKPAVDTTTKPAAEATAKSAAKPAAEATAKSVAKPAVDTTAKPEVKKRGGKTVTKAAAKSKGETLSKTEVTKTEITKTASKSTAGAEQKASARKTTAKQTKDAPEQKK
ncbi:MAG: 1,4-alpha-glucan branching enzyme [Eubacteriales bacterium]|nr:1,4-alpha-glucan branching enzyme [Eubacteriales bacterium]